jgi:ABC-2 type transport system permease protein
MNLRRIRAVAWKEFIHIFRDPRSLGMAIAIPMLLLLLFGYALTMDLDRVPLMVWDQDATPASRDLAQRFAGSRYFALQKYVGDYRELTLAIDAGQTLAALVIPRGVEGRLRAGQATTVQWLLDGSDANTATLAQGYARAVVQSYSQDIALQSIRAAGGRAPEPALRLESRIWFNPDLHSRNFIIPGLVAVIMMVLAALLTSLTIAREWERGTMEQLISTPVKGPELILGKLLPYFFIGMFDVLLSVLMGAFLFQVPLHGSVPLLFGMAAVFLLGTLSMGMLFSIVTRNQLLATQLAMMLTFLPSFLLSGFMFAIRNMPEALQAFTYIVPARYFINLLRGIYLKGVGLEVLAVEAALLTTFAVAMFVLAIKTFKKKVA